MLRFCVMLTSRLDFLGGRIVCGYFNLRIFLWGFKCYVLIVGNSYLLGLVVVFNVFCCF